MDAFDQYLYDELVNQYRSAELSQDEYEELYYRFCSLDHLREVKPYLFAMRFLGLGIPPEPQAVLSELGEALASGDVLLGGLYHDLSLFSKEMDPEERAGHLASLQKLASAGYGTAYLKKRSHVTEATQKKQSAPPRSPAPKKGTAPKQNPVKIRNLTFCCGDFQGTSFAAGEIDYLHALVRIEPLQANKHITVRSQIFLNNEPFSQVFTDEYDLASGSRQFRTTGWGNVNHTCYSTNKYTWVLNIVGEAEYRQPFWMYSGKLDKYGPKVTNLKLFSSKFSGALEEDRRQSGVVFSAEKMECLYFEYNSEPVENPMCVQIFKKLEYLEESRVLFDDYTVMSLNSETTAFWTGWGYREPGHWKKGLYRYTTHIGECAAYTGTFTVI